MTLPRLSALVSTLMLHGLMGMALSMLTSTHTRPPTRAPVYAQLVHSATAQRLSVTPKVPTHQADTPRMPPPRLRSDPPRPATLSAALVAAPPPVSAAVSDDATSGVSTNAGPNVAAQQDPPTPSLDYGPRIDANWAGNLPPAYPFAARRLGEQGSVHLDVHVDADGSVIAVHLRRSSGSPRLDRSAMDTLRLSRFGPAQRGGQPVAAWYHAWQWIFNLEG